jgi:CMP-N,N'-diacetyllegionaminic acid synthase
MVEGLNVLAVVPARSGSKGIRDKNMALVGGLSLIARAAKILAEISWIDRRIISTDSERYAEEGRAHGLDAPFMRPPELSTDTAGALETFVHALRSCEQLDGHQYDVLIVAEPTSPLREPSDIEMTVKTLLMADADAALTVSRLDTKAHPHKVFTIINGRLRYFSDKGSSVTARQSLDPLYSRNGLCYCYRRCTLLEAHTLITNNTVSVIIDRPVANVDEPVDLLWAEFLLERANHATTTAGTSAIPSAAI